MTIYHKHHITPKHMGGTNDPSNIVKVTAEQHALLHKQLWEDLGQWQDYVAWKALTGSISSAEATIMAIKEARKRDIGKKRKPHSEETKKKLSILKQGKKHSEETKKKMSDWAKTQKHSEERRLNQSKKMKEFWKKKKLALSPSF